jgi:tRNA threonylcarbamoyladenosine biosynthesis protein TsaE
VTSLSTSPKHLRKSRPAKPRIIGTEVAERSESGKRAYPEWSSTLWSPNETSRLGRIIGKALRGGEVLGLKGLLGAGKTTLVRGIAAGLQADPKKVASPTFVLIHEYRGRLPLIHADLYRVGSEMEASSLGLEEYFNDTTVTAVEWADRAPGILPPDRLDIRLDHRDARARDVSIRALGPASTTLLAAIRAGYVSRRKRNPRARSGASRRLRS